MKLFALNSSIQFGNLVAREMGIALSRHEEITFADGEHECRSLENVRNEDVYVIQSLYDGRELSINDKLCRLLFFIGSLKDASARKITAVLPYLCYARKDQKSEPRGPVTTRYLAQLLEASGADHLVTIDIHDVPAYQNAFRIPAENLEAGNLFIDHLLTMESKQLVILSPDIGGVKRAELFQKKLAKKTGKEAGLAFKEKYRKAGVVSGETIVGDVKDKSVVIIDDIISTGSTIARSVEACRKMGAREVITMVTHGIFSGDAKDILQDDLLKRIIVTNTIDPFRLEGTPLWNKTTVLDVAPLFAGAIKRMHEGGSLVQLLE